jgi:F0F1-type ATP synthase gamma subunit
MAMAVHIKDLSKDSDKIIIVYNEFKSAISYVCRHMELMPEKRFIENMQFAKLYN